MKKNKTLFGQHPYICGMLISFCITQIFQITINLGEIVSILEKILENNVT